MNWNEIQEKYPKAFAKTEDWVKAHFFELEHTDRNLYDFFDENKIWITILQSWGFGSSLTDLARSLNESTWDDVYFDFIVNTNSEDQEKRLAACGGGSTRLEAETAAFTKAFKILEDNES